MFLEISPMQFLPLIFGLFFLVGIFLAGFFIGKSVGFKKGRRETLNNNR